MNSIPFTTTTTTPLPQSLTQEDIKKLSAEFPKESLGVKVQSLSKDKTKAMLILYASHTDVMVRLELVDPAWSSTVLHEWWEPASETYYVKMRLSLRGITRENVGDGREPKAAYSDALKRCAMLFGVGRVFYDSRPVWVPYDETKDRYREWTVEDYYGTSQSKPVNSPNVTHQVSASTSSGLAVPSKSPGEVEVPFGKNKGFKIKDLRFDQIENDLSYWETRLQNEGKEPSGALKTYLEALGSYLKTSHPTMDQMNRSMRDASQDDTPF